jgi:cytochrome c-type biogenesis protein CcmH
VLAGGLVLGTVLVWRVLGQGRGEKKAAALPDNLIQRDLEGKREILVAQLRELEDSGSKRSAEQLARERYALELEAARVLLALDTGRKGASPAPVRALGGATEGTAGATAAGPVSPAQAGVRGFLWGTLSAGAVGLLLFFVYSQARSRPEGGSLTGDVGGASPMGSQGAAAGPRAAAGGAPPGDASSAGPEEVALRERVAKNPDDLGARMDLARAALARQDMMAVWNETKAVLERSPGHAQALAYQALVRLAMGQGDKAIEMLEQSRRNDPELIDAYVHLALVYVRLGRMGEAEKAIADASRKFPDQAAALQRLLAELQQNDNRPATAAAGESDPHAGLAPSGAAPAATKKGISGTVELDPSLAGQIGAGGILFVFVREAGFGAGPPVAARRLPVSSFPVAFEIGEADAMMGQAFPNELLVEARLDADGDPTTRPPTDPKARQDDVKAGSKGVKLVLKRAS